MCGSYKIFLGDLEIGNATVSKEGLYYRFSCYCRLSGEVMYRLKLQCEKGEFDLGVCIPIGSGFGVNTRLPVKDIGEGALSFYVTPRHTELKNQFVPIRADEPFTYLDKLENAYLEIRKGSPVIVISEGEHQPEI